MKVGFIGLPGSGKTTCFNLVTGRGPEEGHFGGEARLAVVRVPDPRVERIAEVFGSKQVTHPEVTFVDLMAVQRGRKRPPAQEAAAREASLSKVAGDADAFALVIQCFGDLDHEGNPLDPRADLEALLLEMTVTDLAVIERRARRLESEEKAKQEKDAWEHSLLGRCAEHLGAGGLARDMKLEEDEQRHLRGFSLLTMRPLLAVLNVAEDDLEGERAAGGREAAEAAGLAQLVVSAELEREIAELEEEERGEFLADYGLSESGCERFIRACYDLLDVITFFTVNENEARAWTISTGTSAREAAGKVHSDMYEGFIRAEVTPFEQLDELGSMAACKERGAMRVEGREYLVQDGDILQIRFSR
jgi:GTP-binding protein YchF